MEMGLKPSEKTPYPVSITYPARSLNLLVSSVTSNVSLTTWSQVGNCCLSSTIRGAGLSKKCSTLDNYCVMDKIISHEMHKDQCRSFQLTVLCYRPICLYSKGTWWLSEVLPLSLSLRSRGQIPMKSSSLQLQLDMWKQQVVVKAVVSMLEMGTDLRMLVTKVSPYMCTHLSKFGEGKSKRQNPLTLSKIPNALPKLSEDEKAILCLDLVNTILWMHMRALWGVFTSAH